MLRGVLPSDALLDAYQLREYRDIKAAVASGDVAALQRCLDDNQVAFVQAGTYLLLEKLLLATYRRLVRKYVCGGVCGWGVAGRGSRPQLPLPSVQRAPACLTELGDGMGCLRALHSK